MNTSLSLDVDDEGGIRVCTDAGHHLFTLEKYRYTSAEIYELDFPITSTEILLRSTKGLAVGDAVELRNEYQDGRVNEPIVHGAVILGVGDGSIVIDEAPAHPALRVERGAFLWKTRSASIGDFAVTTTREREGRQYWHVAGESDELRVRLSIDYDLSTMNLVLAAERAYLTDVHIVNEHIALASLPPMSAAFRKNRKVERTAFTRHIRLERQGAQFSDGQDRHVLLQHVPRVSSLRVSKNAPRAQLVAVSEFYPPPNDLSAAEARGNSYASGWSEPGKDIAFEIVFDDRVDAKGVRAVWRDAARKPVAVGLSFLLEGAEVAAEAFECDPSTISDDFVVDADVQCDRISVALTAGATAGGRARAYISHLDTLFGGRAFTLVVNTDDYRDHRFYSHLEPERREVMGPARTRVTENRSAYRRKAGDVVHSEFSLHLGPPPALDLRVMHVPHGYESMLIWTEHADASTLASHRAAYFGRSDITEAGDAVGGFVGWGIPVTKSVYFDNPARLPARPGMGEQAALGTDPEFWRFCEQLEEQGHDICLHSDQPQSSTAESSAAAIDIFYSSFRSSSWIDHSPLSVHGGASAQGARRGSPYYAVARWRRHGVRFFWSVGNEDFSLREVPSGLNVLETSVGDDRITPLYWEHEVETPGLCFWPALRGGWSDVYTQESIDELVRERGVCINHTYPGALYGSLKSSKRYLQVASDGSARTTQVFETSLRVISRARDAGRLLPTTVTRAFTYLRQIDRVAVELRPDDTAVITNLSGDEIPGFSLALAKGEVEAVGSLPELAWRDSGDDVLISLTLAPHGRLLVKRDGDSLSVSSPAPGSSDLPLSLDPATAVAAGAD